MKKVFSFLISSLKIKFRELLSVLYNENCIVCGCSKDTDILCKNCLNSVEFLSGFAHSKIEGVEIYSACIYEGVIKTLIHKIKFGHRKDVARVLGDILSKYYQKILENSPSADCFQNLLVVPVPTSSLNIRTRGYNNVFETAKVFAEKENLKISKDLLIKIKDTKPQYKLSKPERKTNVKGCFGAVLNSFSNETVLLIDDIFTTGATLEEAIKTLQKEGVEKIICITLSKAV